MEMLVPAAHCPANVEDSTSSSASASIQGEMVDTGVTQPQTLEKGLDSQEFLSARSYKQFNPCHSKHK